MSPRATHRWLAWLLPLLVLRAFVPAGFMLSWSGNELELMLCSGTGPMVLQPTAAIAAAAHDSHAHNQADPSAASHHQHHGSGSSSAHENSLCPFAVAGSTDVPLPEFAVADLIFVSVEHRDLLPDPELRSASVLIDRIRGPPFA